MTEDDAGKGRELVENSDGTRDGEILESANVPVTIYDLDFLSERGIGRDYVKEVTSLEAKQVSRIVKLPSSYAFFRVLEIKKKHVKTKEEAIVEIKEKISMQKREQYLSKWLQKRYNECTIKINEAALGKLEGANNGKK
jgi:parvulin-like peptidyl-prolyl isomerase